MPLTTSTMRAAALMPLCVYFHFSPGSYCIGAASQSGTRSASVFACCAAGPVASPSPDVCVRICVIVRFAGLPEGVFRLANSGRYFATGSVTLSLPSSCSMRIATPVTGLVIEAIQNSVSGVIGRFAATSAKPVVSRWSDLVLRDDDGDRAGDFVLRDHLLHRRADAGERGILGEAGAAWRRAQEVKARRRVLMDSEVYRFGARPSSLPGLPRPRSPGRASLWGCSGHADRRGPYRHRAACPPRREHRSNRGLAQ